MKKEIKQNWVNKFQNEFTPLMNFGTRNSESDLIGPRGSFSNSFGIDIFSTPGVIKAAWEPQKETETDFITEFCKFAVDASTGTSFWFGSSGTIYNRTGDATPSWGTVYKGGAITGAGEFRDFIYWVRGDRIYRYFISRTRKRDVKENERHFI